jgi:hypothetical protein
MYLDAEDKVSNVVAAAGRGVAARDLLSVDVGHDGNVLSDGQVQDVILIGERKLVPRKVQRKVRELALLFQCPIVPLFRWGKTSSLPGCLTGLEIFFQFPHLLSSGENKR